MHFIVSPRINPDNNHATGLYFFIGDPKSKKFAQGSLIETSSVLNFGAEGKWVPGTEFVAPGINAIVLGVITTQNTKYVALSLVK